MPVDVAATIAGLTVLQDQFQDANKQIVADAASIIQGRAQKLAPVGVTGNSTDPPGTLRRSIITEGPYPIDANVYQAQVGPTTKYGRQRELGGSIRPKSAKALHFFKFGDEVYIGPSLIPMVINNTYYIARSGVYQHPHPYMKPAVSDSESTIESMVLERVAAVIAEAG